MVRFIRLIVLSLIVATVAGVMPAQQQARKKKKLLAIGAVAGFQHDSVSNGLATMWKLGQESAKMVWLGVGGGILLLMS